MSKPSVTPARSRRRYGGLIQTRQETAMIRLHLAIPLAGALLCAACAIDHPRPPLTPEPPLLTAGDGRVRLAVDQVIVPGSPAAWSTDTAWDEYVIRLAAADDTVQITNITLVDFADLPVESSTDRRTLIRDARPDARWLAAGGAVATVAAGSAIAAGVTAVPVGFGA